jgi:hypothetical protein
MVLAFDELADTRSRHGENLHACPDCRADLRDEPGGAAIPRYRCTQCGAGWESCAAGWLFPLEAA